MEIYISNYNGKPIYAQITEQIVQKIMIGTLQEGEMLPSIRFLAKELRISVITTKRAYDDLEQGGYIHTVPGKGSFVAARNQELCREDTLKKLEEHLTKAVEVARGGNISTDEVLETLRLLMEGE